MSTQTPEKEKDSPSKRFTEMVLKEYQVSTGVNNFTPDQTRRVQNYFVKMDMILADNETKRLSRSEDKRDALAFTWAHMNLERFAQDVAIFSQLGLDPMMPNHINLIPYKNARTNKFDIGFIRGYKGLEIVARNFGVNCPDEIVCELVYSNDTFRMFKKDRNNLIASYEFQINSPFDRGEIVGGFIFKEHHSNSALDSIEEMTLEEILKRKPKYASPEFWGGEKDVWKNGKKDGTEKVEGWFKEMCQKTLQRKGWNSVTIDGSRVNQAFVSMTKSEVAHEAGLNQTVDAIAEVVTEKPKTISMNPVQAAEGIIQVNEKLKVPAKKSEEAKAPDQSNDLFPETE